MTDENPSRFFRRDEEEDMGEEDTEVAEHALR